MTLTLVQCGPWEALYKDGQLVCERPQFDDVVEACGGELVRVRADRQWLVERGGYPTRLSNVQEPLDD